MAIANWPQVYYCTVGNWPQTQQVAGSITVSNWPTSQPVTGTFWPAVQPVSGSFWQTPPATATVANLTIGSAVVTVLASRPARQKATIYNENGTLYIKAGTAATDSDFTWRLTANTSVDITGYTGAVTAISTVVSGKVHVTDF